MQLADGTAVCAVRPDGSVATGVELEEYGISVAGIAMDEYGRIRFSELEHWRVRVLESVMR